MLLVFEGIDGAGKATQIRKAVEYLRLKGRKSVVFAYPDMRGPLGRTVDDLLHGRLLLEAEKQFYVFLADIVRDQRRLKEINDSERIVIADRYCFSTIVYQKCKGMKEKEGMELVKKAGLLAPDLILLLDLDARTAGGRKEAERALDEFESDLDFQCCVRKGFLRLAKKGFLSKRWSTIDASGTRDEVFEKVCAAIDRVIK